MQTFEIYVPGVTFMVETEDEMEALSEVNGMLSDIALDWIEPKVEV